VGKGDVTPCHPQLMSSGLRWAGHLLFPVGSGHDANTCEYIRSSIRVQAKEKIRVWDHTFPMMKHSFLWFAVRETRINRDETIVYRYQPDVRALTAQPCSPGGRGWSFARIR